MSQIIQPTDKGPNDVAKSFRAVEDLACAFSFVRSAGSKKCVIGVFDPAERIKHAIYKSLTYGNYSFHHVVVLK